MTWRFCLFGLLLALLTAFSVPTATADTPEPTLEAGAAKVDIVPPFPTRMGGYSARDEEFTGVSFPIYARALVVRNEDTELAVIGSDIIGVSQSLVEDARASIEEATGIPGDHVLISATHSHSGPSGWQERSHYGEEQNEPLFDFLVERFTESIVEAQENLRPAVLAFNKGHLDDITRNRQGNNTVIDPDVSVLKVQEPETREVIATLINFTGHPVILGSSNTLISGEYPGYASKVVEEAMGGVALFTQGACGDVTMRRSGDPHKEVERLGRVVAGVAIKAAETAEPVEDAALFSCFEQVEVPLRDIQELDDAERLVEEAQARVEEAEAENMPAAHVEHIEDLASKAQNTRNVAYLEEQLPGLLDAAAQSSVHVMQIGPLVMAGMPGEVFVEYALEMKQRVEASLGRPFILVGFANDYTGYIVTPRAAHTGGYEAGISRVSHEAGRILLEKAMNLANMHADPAE